MADKQPQWVMTQKKTFTKWANVQLSGAFIIKDVEKDLDNGLILIALFEALRKMKVNFKYNRNPKMRVARLENTEQALKFIIADGVHLVNIDAQNICDGNLKLILGLLWTLILKYQISKNKMDASRNALLEWVNSKIAPNKINNFSKDWNSGDTLAQLIHALEPTFIDMDDTAKKEKGADRIRYGETIAEDKMNIPSIIDPEDMALPEPDELSVMAYVSYYRHYEAEKEKALGEAERLAREALLMKTPDPSKCLMAGPGLKTGEVLVPQVFTVTAKNCKNEQIPSGGVTWNAHVFDPEGKEVEITQKDNGDGTYEMTYIPLVPGKHKVEVAYEDKQLKQSPVTVLIEPAAADPNNTYADGAGVTECQAGTGPVEFVIHSMNKVNVAVPVTGAKYKVLIRAPSGEELKSEIKDNGDGTYTVNYSPIPGIDTVYITLLNQGIKDSPYKCKVFQDPSTACIGNSYAYGPGVEGKTSIDKTPMFRIQGVTPEGKKCTKGGDVFVVEVKDPKGKTQKPKVIDRNNGKYDVKYKAKVPGVYDVTVQLKNPENAEEFKDIKGSVYHPQIDDGVSAKKCTVTGQGIEEPNDQDDNIFVIKAKDFKGDDVPTGGHPFQVIIDQIKESDKAKAKKAKEAKEAKKKEEKKDDSSSSSSSDSSSDEEKEDDGAEDLFNMLTDDVEPDEKPAEEVAEEAPKETEEKKEEAKPEEEIEGKKVPQKTQGSIPCTVVDKEDGTYEVHYKAEAGEIKVKILLNNEKVAKSPYYLDVEEDADADESGVENFCFVVEAKNRRGQVQTDGKAKFTVDLDGPEGKLEDQKIKVKHLGEGKYFISYTLPSVKGDYNVNCKLNRRHIANSPFKQSVN
ncbi:Gelation factor, putative [Entamoeba invadens IP1]|uniref:Gelation factor, putative n=1 Tax=Entamoeba invadens IP1 TaxID=370355 RepID=A0A0A1TUF1_ENTIV|nr:Gelation factor, putative [Entamoeba invadens IP1]ELP83617.1 Gelation factor, putative [Entamoeba invadens IP1]|eukprot:XP_004182963.1 Gelation factor, putative [Entamoeba invadens IP1]